MSLTWSKTPKTGFLATWLNLFHVECCLVPSSHVVVCLVLFVSIVITPLGEERACI